MLGAFKQYCQRVTRRVVHFASNEGAVILTRQRLTPRRTHVDLAGRAASNFWVYYLQCTPAATARARPTGRESCREQALVSASSTRGSMLHSGWRQTAASSETTT